MHVIYFATPLAGWVFLAVLMSLLAVGSYVDLRRMVVPKWLTLPLLGLGILANVLRGIHLAAAGAPGFEDASILGGACDGLLFSLGGFASGFALFLVLWLLGTCGGGDVKLVAALGAWIGAKLVIGVVAVTLVVVACTTFVRAAARIFRGRMPVDSLRKGDRPRSRAEQAKQRLTSYAAAVAVGTAVVLLWAFRVDLGLAQPPAAPVQEAAHVR